MFRLGTWCDVVYLPNFGGHKYRCIVCSLRIESVLVFYVWSCYLCLYRSRTFFYALLALASIIFDIHGMCITLFLVLTKPILNILVSLKLQYYAIILHIISLATFFNSTFVFVSSLMMSILLAWMLWICIWLALELYLMLLSFTLSSSVTLTPW